MQPLLNNSDEPIALTVGVIKVQGDPCVIKLRTQGEKVLGREVARADNLRAALHKALADALHELNSSNANKTR